MTYAISERFNRNHRSMAEGWCAHLALMSASTGEERRGKAIDTVLGSRPQRNWTT